MVSARVLAWLDREERSRAWLARRLGVTDMWLHRRLSGRHPWPLDDVARVADVLDVDVAHLLVPIEDDEEPDVDALVEHLGDLGDALEATP